MRGAVAQQMDVSCLGGHRAATIVLRNKEYDLWSEQKITERPDWLRSRECDLWSEHAGLANGNRVMRMLGWQEASKQIISYLRVPGLQLSREK